MRERLRVGFGLSATVTVESAAGVLLTGTFPVASAVVPITYVTTADAGKTLLVHARNTDSKAHTIARLVVDGAPVADQVFPRPE